LAGGVRGVTVTVPVKGVGKFESGESVYVSTYGRANAEADEAGTVIVVTLSAGELCWSSVAAAEESEHFGSKRMVEVDEE
jgi:hypothetical protein